MALSVVDPSDALELAETPGALPAWVGLLEPVWALSKRLERAGEFLPASFTGRPEAIMAAILTGLEVGQGPLWSLRSIFIVNGRPGMYAEAQRALVLGAGHELWPVEQTDAKVTMAGRRRGTEHTVHVTWTMADATRAGLAGRNPSWKAYPRQLLTARATAELCRLLFADVIGGVSSVEELADGVTLAPVTELDAPKVVKRRRADMAEAEPAAVPTTAAAAPVSAPPPLPGEPGYETEPESVGGEPSSPLARAKLMALTTKAFPGITREARETYRHALTALVSRERESGPTIHHADLEDAELLALSARLEDVRAGRLLVGMEPSGAVVASTPNRQAIIMPPADESEAWSVVVEDREP